MIYAILGAIVVGLSLGIFGSGGSILTVPVLIYLLHHQDKAAIAESLAIVGAIALISAIPYAKAKLVDWSTAFIFGLPGMAGTYLGAWIAAFVPGYVQLFVFAGVMLLAALQMWRRAKKNDDASPDTPTPKRSMPNIGAEGLGALPEAVRIARSAQRVLRTNIAISITYNVIGIAVAAAGWLHPAFAAILMVASSVIVTARSLSVAEEHGTQPHQDTRTEIDQPRLAPLPRLST